MSSNAGSLGDLQRAFQDYLLASSDTFQSAVRDSSKADRITLLDVYRDGYALRLIEALTTDYPGVMAMAGPADFDHMARAYIAAHPSRHPSVRWYGSGLADFLSLTEPYSRTPAAAEMARFEWALGEAFDSPDVTPITADALMALPQEAWESLAFTTLPSLRRLVLAFEAPQAWQRREEVEAGDLLVERAPEPLAWAIWRPDLVSNFRSLEADEAAMLDALIEGRSFPELCESVAPFTGDDQAPARAAGLLRAMVEGGMIAGFRY
ncbi:Putative DNA-binding domain-containing protein [Rhodospirillales bacterium URHD0017]|nr:Putative DNA-binding domain-containing protein [Rhodospirillales bacterium URHD0017]